MTEGGDRWTLVGCVALLDHQEHDMAHPAARCTIVMVVVDGILLSYDMIWR